MIHPTADIQSVDIGEGTSIWQYTIVLPRAKIGKNVNICSHCFIENDVWIGNDVTIKSGVQIWDGCYLEDNVFIGPNVTFTNDLFPRSKNEKFELLPTRVLEGATIGANVTILAGVTIGKYAMIGAGSVVTKSIPEYTIWYGNPARLKGNVCKCGSPILSSNCQSCQPQKIVQHLNRPSC